MFSVKISNRENPSAAVIKQTGRFSQTNRLTLRPGRGEARKQAGRVQNTGPNRSSQEWMNENYDTLAQMTGLVYKAF